jgi:hypothetical protein
MSALYRIVEQSGGDPLKKYLERLMKMIPSEVVGLYLVGVASFPFSGECCSSPGHWFVWLL